MITSVTALAAKPIPAYCHGNLHLITPAQWQTCLKLGATHNFPVGLAAIAVVVVFILVLKAMAGSGRRVAVPSTR